MEIVYFIMQTLYIVQVYGVKLFIIHQLFKMQIVSNFCCIFDKSRTQLLHLIRQGERKKKEKWECLGRNEAEEGVQEGGWLCITESSPDCGSVFPALHTQQQRLGAHPPHLMFVYQMCFSPVSSTFPLFLCHSSMFASALSRLSLLCVRSITVSAFTVVSSLI